MSQVAPVGDEEGGVAAVGAHVLQHVEVLGQHHHLNYRLGVDVCTASTDDCQHSLAAIQDDLRTLLVMGRIARQLCVGPGEGGGSGGEAHRPPQKRIAAQSRAVRLRWPASAAQYPAMYRPSQSPFRTRMPETLAEHRSIG